MNKLKLLWHEVAQLAQSVADRIAAGGNTTMIRLYGVPRGGVHAAQEVARRLEHLGLRPKLLTQPEGATHLIDDIIDSGATRERMAREAPGVPLFALLDKQGVHRHLAGTWVEFPWETMRGEEGPEDAVRRLLQYIDPDPDREGLRETPRRVVKSYDELFAGYRQDVASLFKCFGESYDEMVVVGPVQLYSTCEHHLLPFVGHAWVGYLPAGKVVGLSKLARLVEAYARRLQVQERLTQQVTQALDEHLKPLGSACVIKARHLCMCARGVQKQGSYMTTSSMTGAFRSEPQARAEFLSLTRQ